MTHRWKNRPEGSNWGDFGADDQRGRLNLLTPDRVVRAVAEVKTGRTFCLSLPLELPGGRLLNQNRCPPVRHVTRRKADHPNVNYPFSLEHPSFVDVVCDNAVTSTPSIRHGGTPSHSPTVERLRLEGRNLDGLLYDWERK
jgi:hypothetical protein